MIGVFRCLGLTNNDLSTREAHDIGLYCLWGLFAPMFAIPWILNLRSSPSHLWEDEAFFLAIAAGIIWGVGFFSPNESEPKSPTPAPERVYYFYSVVLLAASTAAYIFQSKSPQMREVLMGFSNYISSGLTALLFRHYVRRNIVESYLKAMGSNREVTLRPRQTLKLRLTYVAVFALTFGLNLCLDWFSDWIRNRA